MVELRLSSSKCCLKLATFSLIAAIILHIIGYALPRWSTMKSVISYNSFDLENRYHVGLWQDCTCSYAFDQGSCSCNSKDGFAIGSFKTVQALESIGLIGLTLSGILSGLMLLYLNQNKTIKILNIIATFGSGLCIVIGVIVYAVVCYEDYNELFKFTTILLGEASPSGNNLNTSFILCTISGSLVVLVCNTLFILDLRIESPRTDQRLYNVPVEYSNHGNNILPPSEQTQVTINNAGQLRGLNSPNLYGPSASTVQTHQLQQDSAKL